jgi:hypothetical protein
LHRGLGVFVTLYLFIGVVLLNIPVYFILGKSFFGGWHGFFESFFAMFRSDLQAAFAGDYEGHQIGKFTLLMYVLCCIFVVAAQYHVIAKFLFGFEHPWNFIAP